MNSLYKSKLLFVFLIFLFISKIIASEKPHGIIKGKVLTVDGVALAGAHISLPSLSRGTISNENGEFYITSIPIGRHRIVVSYVGFETVIKLVEIKTNEQLNFDIILEPTPIKTAAVVVTGNPYASNTMFSPQDVSSLSGREKLKTESASLGKSLESLPGIYNLSAGSVAGKPVIRGHSGERVLILSNGVSQEYQQYGERHTPNIDGLNYERIEIIKGPASLLYGSDAIGGAVNLIPHPFHFNQLNKFKIDGVLKGGFYSNNNEYFMGIKLNGSIKDLAFNGSVSRKKGGNFYTPKIPTFSETLQNGDPKFTGEIPYTNFEQFNTSFGLGYLTDFGIISINYRRFLNKNNFLLPTELPIGVMLENHEVNLSSNLPFNNFIIKTKISYQNNHRLATKGGLKYTSLPDSANVDLILNVLTAKIDVENVDIWGLSGTIGSEVKHYDHENVGIEPLQPTGNFTSYAAYVFEEWKNNKLTIDFGARFDYRSQTFLGTTTNPLLPVDDNRSYSSFSGSIGAAYRITDNLTAAANLSRGFRTPSFFNLYVYGNHGGVFAFQIGEPNLKNEVSIDMSGSIRFKNEFLKTNFTVYQNSIQNYIYLYNAPDHPFAPEGQPFVFAHSQADAKLFGIEFSADLIIQSWFLINGSYSTIKSEFTSGSYKNDGLPLMPPDRITAGIKFLLPSLSLISSPYLSLNTKIVSSKNAAGIYEPFAQFDDGIGPNIPFGVASTKSYQLYSLGFGFDLNLLKAPIMFDLEVTNLLDSDYRAFLDTYKGYTLSPGRSVNLRLSIPFNN